MRVLLALTTALCAPYAFAADYVETQGRLSDDAFYRLVACGAAPGADCALPFVRWSKTDRADLRVGVMRRAAGFPAPQTADAALDAAIEAINGADAGLTLRQTTRAPHITTIERAAIILARDLPPDHYRAVLLEELVQAMGLLTDIRNTAYAGRSIFAADDNLTTALQGQDLVALRRHYKD